MSDENILFAIDGRHRAPHAQPARPAQQLQRRDARRSARCAGTRQGRRERRACCCSPAQGAASAPARTSAIARWRLARRRSTWVNRSRATTSRWYSTLRALPMPVVCAVNGVAAGAGANLALACDIVIAAKSASFIEAFCKIGLIPDSGGTYFLPRLVGTARAMGLAAARRQAPRGAGGELGTHLEMRRRRRVRGRRRCARSRISRSAPTEGLARDQAGDLRQPRPTRWKSSSTSSAICSASSATAPTTAKVWPPSWQSARRSSQGE